MATVGVNGMEWLQISVNYQNNQTVLHCSRNQVLRKISRLYNIPLNEIEMYQSNQEISLQMSIEELWNNISIEIIRSETVDAPETPCTPEPIAKEFLQQNSGPAKNWNTQSPPATRSVTVQTEFSVNDSTLKVKRRKCQRKNHTLETASAQASGERGNLMNNNEVVNTDISAVIVATMYQTDSLSRSELSALRKMEKSFVKRRRFILKTQSMVPIIKDRYPFLFTDVEVLREIDRIFCPGKCREFIAKVDKYSDIVLEMAKNPIVRLAKRKRSALSDPTQKKYVEAVGALLVLPSLLFEDSHCFHFENEVHERASVPTIVVRGKLKKAFEAKSKYEIHVEGEILCVTKDIKVALLCLIGSYFIFNIAYSETNFRTFVLIERLFLNVTETSQKEMEPIVKNAIRHILEKATRRDR